jgi:rhodanese-related sulfurtransferase
MEVTFKAKETGVFQVFCNGDCPTGDGSRYGRIIVMDYEPAGDASFTELDAKESKKLIAEKKPLILDVRTPQEYHRSHIAGAKLIPLQQLDKRVSEIADHKKRDILLYCRSGNRSTVAAQILERQGFKKLHHLRPGIIGWQNAGFAVNTK